MDPAAQRLLQESRQRPVLSLHGRERRARGFVSMAFLAVALPLAMLVPSQRPLSLGLLVILVAAYAVASRVEFDAGTGYTVPVQLLFVPMLFLLPAPVVPAAVALGLVLGRLPEHLTGRTHVQRAILPLGNSWHAVGPALVVLAAGEPAPDWGQWPLLLSAFAAMVACDWLVTLASDWAALGVAPRVQARTIAWTSLLDALLTPPGMLVAVAVEREPFAAFAVVPLCALLAIFARERRARIDHTIELSNAYRGTALLLGDVVEADDEYTGSHSRGVLDLSLAVADRLGLEERQRRNVEFGALLHDVGKIRVPNEIINKAGPLDDEEWRVMKQHTIEGQRILERVGGVLAEVGVIVRASHERYDGRGYPDGLAGNAIPLESRIVSCCDAFSAMTTTRRYRKAMPMSAAVAELRRCSGTQFDPDVVAALLHVIAEEDPSVLELPALAAAA